MFFSWKQFQASWNKMDLDIGNIFNYLHIGQFCIFFCVCWFFLKIIFRTLSEVTQFEVRSGMMLVGPDVLKTVCKGYQ